MVCPNGLWSYRQLRAWPRILEHFQLWKYKRSQQKVAFSIFFLPTQRGLRPAARILSEHGLLSLPSLQAEATGYIQYVTKEETLWKQPDNCCRV